MKSKVLEAIGETGLQQAALVNAALAANDRVKYFFSLLQMAQSHAEQPHQGMEDLRRERLASGVADASFDGVVAGARLVGRRVILPEGRRLLGCIAEEMRCMAVPVLASPEGARFALRLEALLTALPAAEDDALTPAEIAAITRRQASPENARHDSPHQLVMDLHKALNALQAGMAGERLDGAAVYHLDPADRRLVSAFMAGVTRTAPLKFDHPGLATTATRNGARVVIQNDIGTTDAHVIVIHVEGLAAQMTYTDVHPERLQFLQSLLAGFAVSWGGGQTTQIADLAEGMPFHMVVGIYQAADDADLDAYLTLLGSRLVFLIDWNRARKQLRGFLRGRRRAVLLQWAAEQELGHRGFLELGGARLVNEAIEATAGSAMRFGDRLCDVLGDEATEEFLRFVLRTSSEGLRAGHSQGLIRDRVRAELQTHFSHEGKRLLRLAADHAGLVFEIATLVREGIAGVDAKNGARGNGEIAKLARRARRFEHDADQLVIAAREAVRRRPDHQDLLRVLQSADDAADELEEVAFLLDLLAHTGACGATMAALGGLADLLVKTAQEWIKALAHAGFVDRQAHEAADDFLVAIDRVAALEHMADDAERALRDEAVRHAQDFRQLHLYSEIGRSLETAADALKRSSLRWDQSASSIICPCAA